MYVFCYFFYVVGCCKVGCKYGFCLECQCLFDVFWLVFISFCDVGKYIVGMCIFCFVKEFSVKDVKGNVIFEMEVMVLCFLWFIEEQVWFGVLGFVEECVWDCEFCIWLLMYVYIIFVGFQMLGVDMDKLFKEQEKKFCQSVECEQLIWEGVMSEYDDVQVYFVWKCWFGCKCWEVFVYCCNKGVECKCVNNLIKLLVDE